MNVTVFGATGAIGSLTVNELLANGLTVTAYARNPDKIPAEWGDRVRVIIGELSDADVIDRAVAGADVVVSALGPSLDRKAADMPLIEGTRNILDAMKRHGVPRNGTPSVLDPRERRTWQTRLVGFMGRTGLPRAYQELIGMTDLIRNAGLNWTIIRFTAPKDKPKSGKLRVGFYGTNRIGFAVSRADIAAFSAAQVDDDTYLNRAPAISN
ncbi:MAG: NAD(P)-dependent oxidoreductase, partial [Thermoleophilia bacterium]